jgi:DNA repair protein RecO (recombination protein O)
MNPTKNIQGIIYRIYNSGASDKIIYILDREGQKNTILAKGVKKQNSRKAHSIDLGNLIDGKVVEGYSLPILSEIKLIKEFSFWKNSYSKIVLLQFFCEVIDRFSFEGNSDKDIFEIFSEILESWKFAENDSGKELYLACIFILKILEITGHLPNLEESIISNNPLKSHSIYSIPESIGYVGEDDSGSFKDKVPDRIYKTQRFIVATSIRDSARVKLERDEQVKLFKIHLDWLEQVTGNLKSREMVLQILR